MDTKQIARALGRLGGENRAKRLSIAQKKKIASLGGKSRAESLVAAKRVRENFRYLSVVERLRGQVPKVTRVKSCTHRLPGIYRNE